VAGILDYSAEQIREGYSWLRGAVNSYQQDYSKNFSAYRQNAGQMSAEQRSAATSALERQNAALVTLQTYLRSYEIRARQVRVTLSGVLPAPGLGYLGVAVLVVVGIGLVVVAVVGAGIYLAFEEANKASALAAKYVSQANAVDFVVDQARQGKATTQDVTNVVSASRDATAPSDMSKWVPWIALGGVGVLGFVLVTGSR
jgi:hypothetical protein